MTDTLAVNFVWLGGTSVDVRITHPLLLTIMHKNRAYDQVIMQAMANRHNRGLIRPE